MELVEVVRSGFPESVHRASVLAVDGHGATVVKLGDTATPVLPRSANKPLQAVGMLRAGLPVDGPTLALVTASHSGEPEHVRGVRELLARFGRTEADLRCAEDLPLYRPAADAIVAAGGGPARVTMNCSGKHAGMLATCVAAGWPTEGYRDPAHPLQVAIRRAVEDLAGEPVTAVAVDGCGAPAHALTLTGLARAFSRLVTASVGTEERRVVDAMRAHPFEVAGTGRDDTLLMRAVPGLVAKGGAEAVQAVATASGGAVAVKVDDGSPRARMPIVVAALRRLGVDGPAVTELAEPTVYGGGQPVGAVRLRQDAFE